MNLRETLTKMAEAHGWIFLDWQENIKMLSFRKEDARINIYTTKMTVGTCINHPKQGKTQMFRRGVTLKLMNKIFKNPRVHSNRGYQKK